MEEAAVLVKASVNLISQDDRAAGPFLLGILALDWRRRTIVRTHVYEPDKEDCFLFHYEFTGLVRKEKNIQDVDTRSDMLCYVDDDFLIEISDELFHHCLALVCDEESNAQTENVASIHTKESSKGRTHRCRQ